jgi:tripartite-type tricarboxylate transporter receptor subunit TctC
MRTMTFRTSVLALSFVASVMATARAAAGDPWPQRTVRLIVPFAAGADPAARAFAEPLAKRWKQPVVIENRPGAEGMIGVSAFTSMKDDHVLLYYSAAPITTFPLLHARLPYDPARDIVPISSAADAAISVTVSESLNINSLDALVALARAQPGKLNYHPLNGGSFAILLPGFVKSAGLDMVQVSYRDTSLAIQDLVAGRIHVMMSSLLISLPLVRAAKIRLLAVTNKNRAAIAPEVPTAIEAGYPQLEFEGLQGFFGPRGMPAERQDRIAADIRAVAADPAVAQPLAAGAYSARASTPAEFAASIEAQRAQMASLAKLTGIKPAP